MKSTIIEAVNSPPIADTLTAKLDRLSKAYEKLEGIEREVRQATLIKREAMKEAQSVETYAEHIPIAYWECGKECFEMEKKLWQNGCFAQCILTGFKQKELTIRKEPELWI